MKNKVILISIDGMRPDGFLKCGHPFVNKLMEISSYSLKTQTVFPSVTLPCHMSMFHSVTPERHGITTNTYVPQVRPVRGLCEQVKLMGGTSAMFIGWEELRDLSRPGSIDYSTYIRFDRYESADTVLTDRCTQCIDECNPDFVFLYMVDTDEEGHAKGWMGEEYLRKINIAIANVERVWERYHEDYSIVITADHGGHDRTHGTLEAEDMTIPQFYIGERFDAGKELEDISILDSAPTIADIMDVPFAPEWEGKSLAR